VVAQIVEMEVTQTGPPSSPAERAAYVAAIVWSPIWAWKYPLALVTFKLALDDLPGVVAEDHGTGSGFCLG
jgi:hypothetical protein